MPRPLKVWGARLSSVGAEVAEALGPKRVGFDQVTVIAAVRNKEQARLLFGLHGGDMNWFAFQPSDETDVAMAMAEPGQVFAMRTGLRQGDVRAWVRIRNREVVVSDLAYADELLAAAVARKEHTKAYVARQIQGRADRRRRDQETAVRAGEALERLRPVLVEEGIHPDTVKVEALGVWLAPEVAETVAGLLVELQALRGL